ncbi:MAG: ABC transporter substrate-binding protein [Anaerolineae bacterium]|nr:ABC transporter substrate-binding protein [Anaerolineae bacterium]
MKKVRFWLVLTLIGALAVSGCARSATKSGEPRTVKLAMGFIPNVQFTPVYVAVDKGYFAEEGIAIEFDYGMEHDLLKLAGTNELQFVVGSGDQVIMARSQELPVVYVLNWYRRFPVSVAALEPLSAPEDLIGKTVGIPGLYGASYIGWLAMLNAAGIDPAAVNLISIGYTQAESLATGQVDAAVVYAMNEPVRLREQGYEVSELLVADYVDFVSNGLITNEKTIKEQPDLVREMARAIIRGLQDTLNDPDAAFAICRRYVPEIDDAGAPLQRAVLQAALDFWRGDLLGPSDPAAWEASVAFMRQSGMIEADLDASKLYTNEFVTAK